ncbi:hypothetical protein TrCOL_g8698 [Triparma columacea]|uniref:Uncharacterized protein n=1 Tax=Triparma columacea TaxID=722753 RepID=A0A9W7GI46_9STRA|nr:hypothetical protein TrCOL_g8698 [Triparma columacea]
MSINYTSKEALSLRESNGTVTDSFLRRMRHQEDCVSETSFENQVHLEQQEDYFEAENIDNNIDDLTYDYANMNYDENNGDDDLTENDVAGLASAIIGGALSGSGVLEERLNVGENNKGGRRVVTGAGGGGKNDVNDFADLWEGTTAFGGGGGRAKGSSKHGGGAGLRSGGRAGDYPKTSSNPRTAASNARATNPMTKTKLTAYVPTTHRSRLKVTRKREGGVGGGKKPSLEETLKLRVDGQRQAIKALETVIAGLVKKLEAVKGAGGVGRRGGKGGEKLTKSLKAHPLPPPPPDTSTYLTSTNLRVDLGKALKQNRDLHKHAQKLKADLKETQEKEKRAREINQELKSYSIQLRDELERLREDLIKQGDELDRAREAKKKVSKKIRKKKKAVEAREEKDRLARERDEDTRTISKNDIDIIKEQIEELREERAKDKEEIDMLRAEANKLRHRLGVAGRSAAARRGMR